ncbi:hypothetical protein B0H13DRAFT_2265822 [Mycena leptocephala]|nr:hypothetical protein B0H13DRAFT_2265822 [Mycena leptocephala]
MFWPTVLLVSSLATACTAAAVNFGALSTAITTAAVVNTSGLAVTVGGNVGSVFAVQIETGDTRIIYQALPNNIIQLSVSGPFSNTSFSTVPFIVPGANYGLYYLAPKLTVSEWYRLSTTGIHWGSGSACPDCIQNSGFVASVNTIGLYAMATPTVDGGSGFSAQIRVVSWRWIEYRSDYPMSWHGCPHPARHINVRDLLYVVPMVGRSSLRSEVKHSANNLGKYRTSEQCEDTCL